MSKCLKCGAALPPVGECTACAAVTSPPADTAVPSLLNKDIQINRRTPERTPAVVPSATVPGFADLSRGPAPSVPPGMTPRAPTPAETPEAAPLAASAEPAPAPVPQPLVEPPPAPVPAQAQVATPPPMPPQAQLPGVPSPAPQSAPTLTPPTALAAEAAPAEGLGQSVAPPPPVPAPGALPRPIPTPVPVMTFAPPSRPQTSPGLGAEPLTPRVPTPTTSAPRGSTAAKTASGVQEIHARPASLWRRLLSFSIDTAAIVGVSALYITLASSITGVKAPSSQGLTALDALAAWMHALQSVLVPGFVLMLVLALAYCAVAAFLWNGRTLGRLLLGLRLVDTHGLAPAPGRAIVRALLAVVSFGLFLGGFWMALFDRRGQTLHDKLTSTFVIQPS